MAAQDFRHASQEDHEKVGDFIRRLEQLFKLAVTQYLGRPEQHSSMDSCKRA